MDPPLTPLILGPLIEWHDKAIWNSQESLQAICRACPALSQMRLSQALWRVSLVLAGPALLSTLLLYSYPPVLGCTFPRPISRAISDKSTTINNDNAQHAPFRLLVLGDPQLEGDSSLPDPNALLFPSLRRLWRPDYSDFSRGFPTERLSTTSALRDLLQEEVPKFLATYRKRLDLFGNDYYLAHIYRSLDWYLEPTHVTVLGDLIGSQWISDEEFDRRQWRFWNRVFRHGKRVEDGLTRGQHIDASRKDESWNRHIINVAGNHDIGYAGDITNDRIHRFERAYGKVNWDVTFDFPKTGSNKTITPSLRLIILNDMNLDHPAFSPSLQAETYKFVNEQAIGKASPVEDRSTATILLTHIPLHKADGVCVDGQFFDYGPTGLREQNHLSYVSSIPLLEGIFGLHRSPEAALGGLGRNGIILNGHDHEGCDVYHYFLRNTTAVEGAEATWKARKWALASDLATDANTPGLREITVRSMMGSYGGNAGLLSAWFDEGAEEWRFEYDTCAAGVQHIWWAVHVLDVITFLVLGAAILSSMVAGVSNPAQDRPSRNGTTPEPIQEDRSTVKTALVADLSDDKLYGDTTILRRGFGYEAAAAPPRKRRGP